MQRLECLGAAIWFTTLYDHASEIGHKMDVAGVMGMDMRFTMERIDGINNGLDILRRDGHLSEAQHSELRVQLQDVKAHLPAIPGEGEYLKASEETEKRLAQPRNDIEKFRKQLADTMFQAVADCECNPYPKARPLAPLTKKELEDKIADMKLRIDLERDPNRRLQYRSALRSYEKRLKELP